MKINDISVVRTIQIEYLQTNKQKQTVMNLEVIGVSRLEKGVEGIEVYNSNDELIATGSYNGLTETATIDMKDGSNGYEVINFIESEECVIY